MIKKSKQMRKNFLFLSILNKFYNQYKEYLEEFYECLIKKYIFSDKKLASVYDYEKSPNFDLSSFENYVILFISNSKLDLFKKVYEDIENSKPFQKGELKFSLEKCFKFPLTLEKTFINIESNGEKNETEPKNSNIKKDKANSKLFNSYREFKYLIDNINNESNFKVKLIYLDLYLNVFASKNEIDKLDNLMNTVKSNKEEITEIKAELAGTKKN